LILTVPCFEWYFGPDLIVDFSKWHSECIDGKPNGTMSSCEDVVFGDEGSAAKKSSSSKDGHNVRDGMSWSNNAIDNATAGHATCASSY
jgi:hypothetical protein